MKNKNDVIPIWRREVTMPPRDFVHSQNDITWQHGHNCASWQGVGHDGKFNRDPRAVFSAGGQYEQFWHGHGYPLFDIVHPAFPPRELCPGTKPRPGHHTVDRPEEKGVERSAKQSPLNRVRQDCRQSDQPRNCFNGNASETSERRGWVNMGFPEHTI